MKRTCLLSAGLFIVLLSGTFNTIVAQAKSGLNPAHGTPGHRCDIAVGAPLNSAPATSKPAVPPLKPGQPYPGMMANPPKINTPNRVTANTPAPAAPLQKTVAAKPVAPSSAKVTAGLNPAHGQPGHRCDIPVGAPLSSAPAKPIAPAAVNAPARPGMPNVSGVKLNPAHGQPGHNCTIEVGKPLKQ